jgi:hypothetical protein
VSRNRPPSGPPSKSKSFPRKAGSAKFDFEQQFPRLTSRRIQEIHRLDRQGSGRRQRNRSRLLTGTWKRHVYPDADPNDQNDDEGQAGSHEVEGRRGREDNPLEPTDGGIDCC